MIPATPWHDTLFPELAVPRNHSKRRRWEKDLNKLVRRAEVARRWRQAGVA